jgi:hypothetical protein
MFSGVKLKVMTYDLSSQSLLRSWFHMNLFLCLHSTKDLPDMFLINGQVQFRISQGL